MKRILTVLLWFFMGVVWSQNGNNYWEKLPSPPGGQIAPLPSIQTDTLYGRRSILNEYTIYRSYDAGVSWALIPVLFNGNDISGKVIITCTGKFYYLNPDSIPATQKNYIWTSTDEGQTWQLVNPVALNINGLTETTDKTLLGWSSGIVGTPYEVYRSTDHGQNWSTVLSTPDFYPGTMESYPDHHVLIKRGLNYASFLSNDDGATWTAITTPNKAENVWLANSGTLFAANYQPNRLSRSIDGGITWDTITRAAFGVTGLTTMPHVNAMTFMPSGRILANTDNYFSLLYSENDGISWQYFEQQFLDMGSNYPLPNGDILAYTSEALFRSPDGGNNWQFSSYGLDDCKIDKLDILNDSTIFAATNTGVWRTLNGLDWELLANYGSGVRFGSGQHMTLADEKAKAYISNDWGIHFTEITTTSFNGGYSVHMSPVDSILFAMVLNQDSSNLTFKRSTDYGVSWQIVSDSIRVSSMKFHPSGRYFLSTFNGQLWYSDDAGLNWERITGLPVSFTLGNYYGINIAENGNITFTAIANNSQTVCIRSFDNGTTWVKVPTLPANMLSGNTIYENEQGHLFALTSTAVFRSVDNGNSWHTLPNIQAEYPAELNRVLNFGPQKHAYVGTHGSGIFKSSTPVQLGAYLYGRILRDADADCSTADEQPANLHNWPVEAIGNYNFYGSTDSIGRFAMFIDTGYYYVSVRSPQQLWWSLCDSTQSVYLPENLGSDSLEFVAIALAECPLISVNIAATTLRRCFDNTLYVNYCNAGTEPADSAWVDITLDPYLAFINSVQPHEDLGNNVFRFFVGDLQSGDCANFQLTVNVNCDSTVLGQTHCISAHGFPDTLCTTVPEWSGANLEAAVVCQDSVVLFDLENTGSAPSQTLDYIIIEDDVVMFQGSKQYEPNENLLIPVPANGHTYRLESEQEPGHPFSYRVIAFEEGCGGYESLGYINQFSVNGETPSVHQICVENTGSYDPNDKRGYPIGTGTEHLIRPGQPIEYMIRFQNTGTDTAFTVVVIDTLPQWLNPASLTPGAASHAYTWAISGPGIVRFTFNNILLPDSTTNLAGSQGFVTFNIEQQPDVPLGTQIRNDAAIFFDFNAPVITNETLHTVGVDLISSTLDIPNQAKPAAVTLSPNPASDHTTFQLRKGNFDEHRLQLFDPLGKPVFDTEVSGAQFVMPRGHLPAGAYGWRVTDHRGLLLESGVVVFE